MGASDDVAIHTEEIEITDKLKRYLSDYDLVVLVMEDDGVNGIADRMSHSKAASQTQKRVLFLSSQDAGQSENYSKISNDEVSALLEIYRMYDFSDHFCVLSRSKRYGGLFNYVDTGQLTEEELFEAVLF